MWMSTELCRCHEQVRQSRSPNSAAAHRSTSSADMASKSTPTLLGGRRSRPAEPASTAASARWTAGAGAAGACPYQLYCPAPRPLGSFASEPPEAWEQGSGSCAVATEEHLLQR